MVYVAGVDEVGRGPLAGSVVAAAVILPEDHTISGLTDSKKLTAKRREVLEIQIKEQAIAWAIGEADVQEIDQLNILWASMLAMKRAVESLQPLPHKVLVDGNRCPDLSMESEAIIKGDLKVKVISAASIIAKETRDRQMLVLDQQFPEYGFAQHKGYPTKQHIAALKEYGVTDLHRRSYRPVRECL